MGFVRMDGDNACISYMQLVLCDGNLYRLSDGNLDCKIRAHEKS